MSNSGCKDVSENLKDEQYLTKKARLLNTFCETQSSCSTRSTLTAQETGDIVIDTNQGHNILPVRVQNKTDVKRLQRNRRSKRYYDKHKDDICKRQKERRSQRSDIHYEAENERQKRFYNKHKEEINKRRREKYRQRYGKAIKIKNNDELSSQERSQIRKIAESDRQKRFYEKHKEEINKKRREKYRQQKIDIKSIKSIKQVSETTPNNDKLLNQTSPINNKAESARQKKCIMNTEKKFIKREEKSIDNELMKQRQIMMNAQLLPILLQCNKFQLKLQ